MLIEDVFQEIEKVACPRYAASWDNSGLQVASTRKSAVKMAVFLDATPDSIKEALSLGAECMLSHHPLCLRPRLPDRVDAYREVLALLLGADVPLYAAHTSLDVNMDGPAGWLGRSLDLQKCSVLEPVDPCGDCSRIGYGEAGDLPSPLEFRSLLHELLELAGLKSARLCGPVLCGEIRRLAYCGGSGASLAARAREAGAQLFVTGDTKYHDALDADIPILDVGHHSLEEEMMRRFAWLLQERMPDMEVLFLPSRSPFRLIVESQESCA